MLQKYYAYYAIFEPNESGGFGVRFPDIPELFSGGNDENDAEKSSKEGLAFCLRELDADGEKIAVPSGHPKSFELAPGETIRKVEIDMSDYYPELFPRKGRGGPRANSGRPKLKPGDPRSGRQAGRTLIVKLTDDEFERLSQLSKHAKKTKSEYVRAVVFSK